ncbi:hypothetical protein BD410DRAFT_697498, partial [Rickenella mellea]
RMFHCVLQALICPAVYDTYIKLPDHNSPTPSEIELNPKLFPFFKDCIGALDGSHI